MSSIERTLSERISIPNSREASDHRPLYELVCGTFFQICANRKYLAIAIPDSEVESFG